MKLKEFIKLLSELDQEAEVYFETQGHNQGGETEIFPQAFKVAYESEEGISLRFIEN